MPSNVSANNMTTVHSGSTGIASWFPDVCKTPSPGGPIPIPYPNIAQSSDTADGSSTLKVQGNPIMLKGSNFKMSTGDEAGSAMGVVSNKIKGKAEPVNYSFDVKVDGKNVFRLGDMMLHNIGNPNGGGEPEGQAPDPAIPSEGPECEKTQEEKKDQESKSTSWGNCGIVSGHRGVIQQVATDLKMVIYFRATKEICGHWINAKHQPKPHSCIAGTTITAESEPKVQAWLNKHFDRMTDEERMAYPRPSNPLSTNKSFSDTGLDYIGVIGLPVGDGLIMPKTGGGRQAGASYTGKWMTGDYDLFEVLSNGDQCQKVSGDDFARLKREINVGIHWDAIQHPPQAQWVPNKHERKTGVRKFNMNVLVKSAISGKIPLDHKITFHPERKPMAVLDKPLTVVSGAGVVTLKENENVKDCLVCQGCAK